VQALTLVYCERPHFGVWRAQQIRTPDAEDHGEANADDDLLVGREFIILGSQLVDGDAYVVQPRFAPPISRIGNALPADLRTAALVVDMSLIATRFYFCDVSAYKLVRTICLLC